MGLFQALWFYTQKLKLYICNVYVCMYKYGKRETSSHALFLTRIHTQPTWEPDNVSARYHFFRYIYIYRESAGPGCGIGVNAIGNTAVMFPNIYLLLFRHVLVQLIFKNKEKCRAHINPPESSRYCSFNLGGGGWHSDPEVRE